MLNFSCQFITCLLSVRLKKSDEMELVGSIFNITIVKNLSLLCPCYMKGDSCCFEELPAWIAIQRGKEAGVKNVLPKVMKKVVRELGLHPVALYFQQWNPNPRSLLGCFLFQQQKMVSALSPELWTLKWIQLRKGDVICVLHFLRCLPEIRLLW